MAEEIFASVQVRRDSKANWESVNPILLNGEAAYEQDTDMFKIGDGVKRYSDLPYHNKVGPQGPQGEPGPTPQISMNVSTGNPGTSASVSVTGTAENPVINLTVPKGDTGSAGVYIGTSQPTDSNINVWIDPDGEPSFKAVKAVNGVTADDSGTVTLTPDDLGAATAEEVSQLKDEKVDKSSVVNNYMTTQEGFVADARALKDLNDRMGTPFNAVPHIMLSKKHDWDSVNPGVYYFNTWAHEGGANYPKGGMGVVMFIKSYDGTYGAQYCISDSWLGVRVCSESKWGAWKYLALA